MGCDTGSDLLFSSDVLVENDEGVSLSSTFERSVADYQAEIADVPKAQLRRRLAETVDAEVAIDPLAQLGEKDPRTIGELWALHDHLEAPSEVDYLSLLPVLRLFREGSVRTEGVPDAFVPIPGDQLPEFSDIYSPILAYVWLDDCPPCDLLKRRLESMRSLQDGVLPLAVYGPAYREVLAREYEVTGGPALLFMRDGRVDARLYGAHREDVIAKEIGKIRD